MKKILLATDLTARSDRAMGRAIQIAKEQNAQLHILHVVPPYKKSPANSSLKEQAEDLIRVFLDGYQGHASIRKHIEIVESSEIYQSVLDYAHKIKVDLIVMGLHGKTKFRDLFVGTNIERVVRIGNKPVLMVKDKAIEPYKEVVSAVDFALASRNALRFAYGVCPKAEFEVIHTYFIPTAYASGAGMAYAVQINDNTEKEQHKAMVSFVNTEESYYKKTYGGKTLKLIYELSEGSPYRTLVNKVKKKKADLITIGAHSKSIITPSKLGGVAEDILSNPPCDVLVLSE